MRDEKTRTIFISILHKHSSPILRAVFFSASRNHRFRSPISIFSTPSHLIIIVITIYHHIRDEEVLSRKGLGLRTAFAYMYR
jgi:hypothetical protein